MNLQEVAGGKKFLELSLEAVNFTGYRLIRRTPRNSKYPWIITVLQTESKMAPRFATVSDEEIVAIHMVASFYPSDLVNTKTTFPFRVSDSRVVDM